LLEQILRKALEKKAFDIHLKVGSKPVIRGEMGLEPLDEFPVIDENLFNLFIETIFKGQLKKRRNLKNWDRLTSPTQYRRSPVSG